MNKSKFSHKYTKFIIYIGIPAIILFLVILSIYLILRTDDKSDTASIQTIQK